MFTSKYNLVDLGEYEIIEGMAVCIQREKQLKNWHRDWKINLFRESNPEMIDLAADWYVKSGDQLVIADRIKQIRTS